MRFNFISSLICAAQNGFGLEVDPFVALCHETWDEEALFDALKDLPHGTLRRTRLMYAAQKGDSSRVKWLLKRGARAGLEDVEGRSALYWASWKGHLSVVRELLLQRGVSAEAAKLNGVTALCAASKHGELEVARELLAHGAAPSSAALFSARMAGQGEVVRLLLSAGATDFPKPPPLPLPPHILLAGPRSARSAGA